MKLAIVFPNLSHRKNNDVPGTRFESSDLGGFIIRSPGGLLHTCFGDFQGGTLLCPLMRVCKAGVFSTTRVLSRISTHRLLFPFLIHAVTCHPPIYLHVIPSMRHPSMIHVGNHMDHQSTNPTISTCPPARLSINPPTHLSSHPLIDTCTPHPCILPCPLPSTYLLTGARIHLLTPLRPHPSSTCPSTNHMTISASALTCTC